MIHDQNYEKNALTVMVNNSTYNHLSHHTIKIPQRMSLEIQYTSSGLRHLHKYCGIK